MLLILQITSLSNFSNKFDTGIGDHYLLLAVKPLVMGEKGKFV